MSDFPENIKPIVERLNKEIQHYESSASREFKIATGFYILSIFIIPFFILPALIPYLVGRSFMARGKTEENKMKECQQRLRELFYEHGLGHMLNS